MASQTARRQGPGTALNPAVKPAATSARTVDGRRGFHGLRGAFIDERNLSGRWPVLVRGELRVCTARRPGQGSRVPGDVASSAPADADHAYVQATLRGDLRAFEAL